MKNKKGYTIVEVIVSFVLIMIVMIYLLRTIVVLTNKNNDLLAYEEYTVYENSILKDIYEDVDIAFELEELQANAVESAGNKITFKDIKKDLEIDESNRMIIYDGTKYELPEKTEFRKKDEKIYDVKEINAVHKAYIVTIYLKVNNNEEDLKIVYQNKKLLDYTITFDPNGGTITSGEASVTGKWMKDVQVPTVKRVGYAFDGWYTLDEKTKIKDTIVKLTTTITYKAKWTSNTYTLEYELDSGSHGTNHPTSAAYDEQFTVNNPSKRITVKFTNDVGATVSNSDNITKSYTFNGWDITGMDSVTHTYGSNTTTAKKLTGIKDTKFKNLRSTSGTVTYTAKWTAPSIKLPTVKKSGYTCVWKSGSITKNSGDTYTPNNEGGVTSKTFKASCSAITYKISYTLNGGSVSGNPTSYTVETATFKLNNPTKTNATFTGWTGSNGTTAQKNVSISKGSTGDKSYTANWTCKSGSELVNNTCRIPLAKDCPSNKVAYNGLCYDKTTITSTVNVSCPSGWIQENSSGTYNCSGNVCYTPGRLDTGFSSKYISGPYCWQYRGNSSNYYHCDSGYEKWPSWGNTCWRCTVNAGYTAYGCVAGTWNGSSCTWTAAFNPSDTNQHEIYSCGWWSTTAGSRGCPSGYSLSGTTCYRYTYNEGAEACRNNGGTFSQSSSTTFNGTGTCIYTRSSSVSGDGSTWIESGWVEGTTHWEWVYQDVTRTTTYSCPSGYTNVSNSYCRKDSGGTEPVCNGDIINGKCYKK